MAGREILTEKWYVFQILDIMSKIQGDTRELLFVALSDSEILLKRLGIQQRKKEVHEIHVYSFEVLYDAVVYGYEDIKPRWAKKGVS